MRNVEAVRFRGYELRLRPLTLTKRGQPIDLAFKPLRLLALLVMRQGRLVTHEEMQKCLWGSRTVSFRNGVHVYISQIRMALSDDAASPAFIETVPRQGYCFLAATEVVYDEPRGWCVDVDRRWSIVALAVSLAVVITGPVLLMNDNNGTSHSDQPLSDMYKRGLYLLEQRDPEATSRSLRYFDAAVAENPTFALGHSAAARALGRLGRFEEANLRANQALTLDDDVAEAHVVLGLVDLMYDWAWDDAYRHLYKALQLDENNVQAHQGIATYFVLQGDIHQGIEHMKRARSLDPGSTIVRADFGWFYYFAGDYERAAEICGEALDLAPADSAIRNCLIRSLSLAGRHEAAARHMAAYMNGKKAPESQVVAVSTMQSAAALPAFDKWRLNYYETKAPTDPPPLAALAFAAASSGQYERALGYADAALRQRNAMIPFIAVDPVFKPLQSNPRFQALLSTLGLKST